MAHRPFVQERETYRPARFAQRVREELATLIPGDLKDPRLAGVGFVTITDVQLSPDMKHATVMFALMFDEARAKEVQAGLTQAAGFLRKALMKRLNTKVTPHLVFKYDKGFASIAEMDSLLRKIKP